MVKSAVWFCIRHALELLPNTSSTTASPRKVSLMKRLTLRLHLCMLLSLPPLLAQPAFRPEVKPSLEISKKTGEIVIDGNLQDPGWESTAVVRTFSETYPRENGQPPIGITARITYDEDFLYVAFKIDDDPLRIRASLRERDQMWQDDYVGILLDPYGESLWSYYLFSNPLGVQGDTRFSISSGEDESFDVIYESHGRITDAGYEVEFAVPFRSLRFPHVDVQAWRVNFWVTHPRESRSTYSWAAISRNDPCFLCQFGTMTGMRGIRSSNDIEFLPSVVASQAAQLVDLSERNSGLDHGPVKGEAGLGIRYAFNPSTNAEVTVNPDFSQVESDEDQVDVNTTFALFFSERRPFFQEGSDLYGTWISAVYTRSINDPLVAAKLTSRTAKTSILYLGAYDERSPEVIPFQERSAVIPNLGKSISNIVRVKQSFSEGSSAGILFTDRRLDVGGSGTTFGIDGTIRFLDNFKVEAQGMLSHTLEPTDSTLSKEAGIDAALFNGGANTAALDGESFTGHAGYISLEREARFWSFNIDYWRHGPTFRAPNGFITRNDEQRFSIGQEFSIYPEDSFINEIEASLFAIRLWNFAGTIKDNGLAPSLSISMKGQTSLSMWYLFSWEIFKERRIDGILRGGFNISSNFSDPFRCGFRYEAGRYIARSIAVPVLGRGSNLGVWATIKPMQQLIIEPNFTFAELRHPDTNADFFNGYIARVRTSYQFTREASLRLVLQYNDFSRELSIEPLFTYRINPFSLFYIGATSSLQDFPANGSFSDPNGDPLPVHLTESNRQYFLKFQYLFQL